jgi:y4mF family transcriptional regulator
LYANTYKMNLISEFVKTRRKQAGMTQDEFAEKAGVALTVIRKIEQGKENLSLSKVNQVLHMFGHVLGPINEKYATSNSEIQ